MKKEQLFKLLNKNKGMNDPLKHPLNTFKCILRDYDDTSNVSTHSEKIEGLNHDFTLIFKPSKPFTKKALKGF